MPNYPFAKKNSQTEINSFNKIDELCKFNIIQNKNIDYIKEEKDNLKNTLNNLKQSIKKNCSEARYYKIMQEGTGYQLSQKEQELVDIETLNSDDNQEDILEQKDNSKITL